MVDVEFYIIPEEVFRLGSSSDSRLSHVRPRDVNTIRVNGVIVVVANGKDISVFDRVGIEQSPMTGWVWKFSANTMVPAGLKLVKDKPHHFCIAPMQNMPLDKYKGLLEELALKSMRVFRKEGKLA